MSARDDLIGAVIWSGFAGVAYHQAVLGNREALFGAALLTIVALIDARKVWRALGGRS